MFLFLLEDAHMERAAFISKVAKLYMPDCAAWKFSKKKIFEMGSALTILENSVLSAYFKNGIIK
jgi:hypothetical protein